MIKVETIKNNGSLGANQPKTKAGMASNNLGASSLQQLNTINSNSDAGSNKSSGQKNGTSQLLGKQ
jgi:hypothetical protein